MRATYSTLAPERLRKCVEKIQDSQESLIVLARRYGANSKTIQKWRNREVVHDAPMGPKVTRSRSLSRLEEAVVVAFRVFTQLPLDDCLYSLLDSISRLARSFLHRCLQRHDLPRLAQEKTEKEKKKFKSYPIGYFHQRQAPCEFIKALRSTKPERFITDTNYFSMGLITRQTPQTSG